MRGRGPPIVLGLVCAACNGGGETSTKTITVVDENTITVWDQTTVTVPNTVTNTITNTVTETVTETVTVVDDDLDPGHFEAPLVELAQAIDSNGAIGTNGAAEDHMHVDEVRYRESDERLFYCSYTFGVVDVSDPGNPAYLAQGYEWDLGSPVGRATGCLHVDWDDADPDIVYVSHRGNYDFQPHLSVVDLGSFNPDPYDPLTFEYAPVLAEPLRETDVSYEGLDAANGLVYVALHSGGIGVFERDVATNEMSRIAADATITTNAYDIEVSGNIAYVLDEQLGLFVVDVTDVNDMIELGHVFIGGVDRDIEVEGDFAYIAGGGAGMVIVDVSDPAAPTIASYTPAYGTAVRVAVDGDRAALAAWNDTRVYDVTDRTAPAIVGGARLEKAQDYANDPGNERPDITARTLGVDLHGDYLFVGNWWTPYTFQIHSDRLAPYLVLPEDIFYMAIGNVPVGSSGTYSFDVENHGTDVLTVYDLWATNPAFTIDPVGAAIPPGGEAEFTITYTAAVDTEEYAIVNLLSDDPNQPLRKGYVVGNPVGIGVGDPFPYTEATDVNTLALWTSDSTLGSVTLIAYFATF